MADPVNLGILIVLVVGVWFGLNYYKRVQTGNSTKIYKNEAEARKAIDKELRKDLYEAGFYPVRIKCPNCRLKGTVLLLKGITAQGSECPKCSYEGIEVIGPPGKKFSFKPYLGEDIEDKLESKTTEMVERFYSIGRIKRGGMFR